MAAGKKGKQPTTRMKSLKARSLTGKRAKSVEGGALAARQIQVSNPMSKVDLNWGAPGPLRG